jgi:SOS-response transcriptional repressor LexA
MAAEPWATNAAGRAGLRYPSFRMAPAFTARQGEYLTFIHRYTQKFGVAPSFEDIGRHFGTTPPSVNNMIKTLCARGLLSKLPGVARSLRVLVPASQLPEGEFGASRGKSSARSDTAVPSTADVACVAATAVLDVLMPHFDDGDALAAGLVSEAAQAVHSSLVAAGASSEEALEVYRRVCAEVARWMPGVRGLYLRRKRIRR